MRATKRCPATSQETNQNCSLSSSTSCVHPGHNRKSPVKKAAIRRVLHLLFEGAPSKLRLGGFFFGRSLGFAACPPLPIFGTGSEVKCLLAKIENREGPDFHKRALRELEGCRSSRRDGRTRRSGATTTGPEIRGSCALGRATQSATESARLKPCPSRRACPEKRRRAIRFANRSHNQPRFWVEQRPSTTLRAGFQRCIAYEDTRALVLQVTSGAKARENFGESDCRPEGLLHPKSERGICSSDNVIGFRACSFSIRH